MATTLRFAANDFEVDGVGSASAEALEEDGVDSVCSGFSTDSGDEIGTFSETSTDEGEDSKSITVSSSFLIFLTMSGKFWGGDSSA